MAKMKSSGMDPCLKGYELKCRGRRPRAAEASDREYLEKRWARRAQLHSPPTSLIGR